MKKPQTLSLQDQLLKSGLTNDAKAKQINAEKRKQNKQQRNTKTESLDEVKLNAEQARRQQAERDRELNLQRKQAEEQKALAAQIKQLAEQNRLPKDDNGLAYRFSDQNKVKVVYVAEKLREALVNGRAGIVKIDGGYEIVPLEIALKIQERDAGCIVALNPVAQQAPADDDPYAAYQIPDDLLW